MSDDETVEWSVEARMGAPGSGWRWAGTRSTEADAEGVAKEWANVYPNEEWRISRVRRDRVRMVGSR